MSQTENTPQQTKTVAPEVCPACFSDLVQPTEARAEAAGTVRLTLRCPECEHIGIGDYSWEEARAFGRVFAAGKAELRIAHKELAEENFRDELDCFVLALASDLIGPDDFKPFRYAA
ncbi:MAG: hypothetical protein WAP35_04350 [Solirubrobacterales bacterium]